MRQETNKEIDLLLRRLGRRDGEAVRDAEIDEHHLDADELSSFAQNALPAAARARYTAHLAECSTCRRMATELSLALGVTTAAMPVVAVPASSGLKKFFSSLLSPVVLRYAVPALGVLVVMVVGFMVLRQRQPAADQMVAQVEVQSPSLPSSAGRIATATPASGADQHEAAKSQQPANAGPVKDTTGPRETSSESPARGDVATGTADSAAAALAPAPAPAPTPTASAFQADTPRTVQSVPVIVPKSGIVLDGETQSKKDSAKQEAQPVAKSTEQEAAKEKAQANEPPRDNVRPLKRGATDRIEENKARSEAPTVSAGGAGERAATRRREQESKDEEAETRSVAGRTFRRERGIWTDTAYDSSIRIVQMARGSEQFRALIADEPAIGTIAEQLNGEVIVVWKRRAYRIR